MHFRRALLDRKTEALEELNELLAVSGVVAAFDRPDQLVWRGCSSGKFFVKSIYNTDVSSQSNVDETFKLFWKNVPPSGVQCFGWLSYLGKIKTSEFYLVLG